MKIYILIILIISLSASTLLAQHEADNWYFGINAGISFKNGIATAIKGGQINTFEGCAVVSDKTTGALLFYTDGNTIWNSSHQIMKNGTGLQGGKSSTQSALIVPNPADSLQYYIFTAPDLTKQSQIFTTSLYYSLVSLKIAGGEVLSKNNVLIDSVSEKLTGTMDCSGTGFWVVAHHIRKSELYSYHVTVDSVNSTPVVSNYIGVISDYKVGCMKISPNSTKLALASNLQGYLSLFDFNAGTGKVTNCNVIYHKIGQYYTLYDLSFSPDNTKLYSTRQDTNYRDELVQYELNLPDSVAISSSGTVINPLVSGGEQFQLAPDGKIYKVDYEHPYFLDVIDNPNLKGTACKYRADGFQLTNKASIGLPNFMGYIFNQISRDTVEICPNSSVQLGSDSLLDYTYTWTPTQGLDNPTSSHPIASPTKTTEYKLKTISNSGCENYYIHVVKVKPIKATIEPVMPICKGSSVQLLASGGDTYSWFPTTGLDSATKPNPIATPQVTTRYKVVITQGGCIDSAFVNVVVNQKPIARAGEDKISCAEGNRTQLGDTARAGESYLWTPVDGLSDPRIANPTALPKANTKYVLKVWNTTCPDTAYDEVVVTIIDKTQALISKDTAICRGGSVPLLARGGLTYSWFPTTGLSDPTIQDPIASPLVTTRYKVLVAIGDCIDSAFVTVRIYSVANAGADKTVCIGASAELGAQPESGNMYSWQPSTYLDNPNISNPQCTPQTDIQYILTVIGDSGCVGIDTVQVRIGTIVAKVSNDTAICSGSNIQLLASGGATYKWSPSIGLSDTTIENPIASPTKTTTYKVKVSSGTCEDSAFVTITVNPQPTANAGEDKTLCIGASTEIGEAAQAGFTYQWQPTNGLDDATKANPTASPTNTTQYILTVTGNGGCTAHDTVLVTIGTIKAIVSNDTSICEGASVKLFASGGAKYEWSPSAGLDNPFIATPTANPTSTTKYKLIVSSGTCIDSAFVTVTILPPPNANAGNDTTICVGASTQIGIPAEAGNSYLWSPSTGLSSPTASQTTASPATTTTYTLTVTNSAGCVKSDEVIVTVNTRNARSFTLKPDTVTILPGKQFTANLEIPSGVADWSVKLKYDPLLITYNSITGAQAIPDDLKGELLINGNGGSRSIPITFDAYLPHTTDTIYPVKLSVDTSKVAECETWSATGNILMLADYCGKNIRVVSSTGKKYYLTAKDRSIDFGVGLPGNVRLEVFDYVGNSVLVVSDGALEAGEYSAALDLPVGVYYCRMTAGIYQCMQKVMMVR